MKKLKKATMPEKRQRLIEFNGDHGADEKEHCITMMMWTIQGLAMKAGWAKPPEAEIMDPRMMARIFVASLTDKEAGIEYDAMFPNDEDEDKS